MQSLDTALELLVKECGTSQKYSTLRQLAERAIHILQDNVQFNNFEIYQLRDAILEPLQSALESGASKLAICGLNGIQFILHDDRFQSSMESELEEHWLPMQVLQAVWACPGLSDDIQVAVMKVLLDMILTTTWCMNASIIVKIIHVCVDVFEKGAQTSVKMATRSCVTQMLRAMVEKYGSAAMQESQEYDCGSLDEESRGALDSCQEQLHRDVIDIFNYLCERLAVSASQQRPAVPLFLDGLATMLESMPSRAIRCRELVDTLWQQLCPTLVALLANPKAEKSSTFAASGSFDGSASVEMGRGSGVSLTAPNLPEMCAKSIYSIAVRLVALVGDLRSMRPVLESLFHRMLLYPPVGARLAVLRAVRDLFLDGNALLRLAGPTLQDKKTPKGEAKPDLASLPTENHSVTASNIRLLKIVMDSIQECSRCPDFQVAVQAVDCVDLLLNAIMHCTQGEVITDYMALLINRQFVPADLDCEPSYAIRLDSQINVIETDACSVLTSLEQSKVLTDEGCGEDAERQCARDYVVSLMQLLPSLIQLSDEATVDMAVQQFASNFCSDRLSAHLQSDGRSKLAATRQDNGRPSRVVTILNADAVYYTTYAALLLNLKMSFAGCYLPNDKNVCKRAPLTAERHFIESVLGCGLLLFLSEAWLSEVYRQVVLRDFLHLAGYRDPTCYSEATPLFRLLCDIDGLGSRLAGGQLLSVFRRPSSQEEGKPLSLPVAVENGETMLITAGRRFAKCIIVACWDGLLETMCALLRSGGTGGGVVNQLGLLLGKEGAREDSRRTRDAIVKSLEGLQLAARLASQLGLQQRCGAVFAQLAASSCQLQPNLNGSIEHQQPSAQSSWQFAAAAGQEVRMHASHALSLDVILSQGLEMGSHVADCWRHVFRACLHVATLERLQFGVGNSFTRQDMTSSGISFSQRSKEHKADTLILPSVSLINQNQLTKSCDELDLRHTNGNIASSSVALQIHIPSLIQQSRLESKWETARSVLTVAQTSKVLCALTALVDRLFEEAAEKLTLTALSAFVVALCESSAEAIRSGAGGLLLTRLSEVLLRVIRSSCRPLFHVLRLWAAVRLHLTQACASADPTVAKFAVSCIHECVTAMLMGRQERAYFHVNEAFCQPFEMLLQEELCEGDAQDQIVCSICELVEVCAADIRSGWRPLFGALRAVKLEFTGTAASEQLNKARQRHVNAVFDVFDIFLATDNVLVFANAAVDCILCLLKYVRGPSSHLMSDASSCDEDPLGPCFTENNYVIREREVSRRESVDETTESRNLCRPALGYLARCAALLQSMWSMPACPEFKGAGRASLITQARCVEALEPEVDLRCFLRRFHTTDLHIPALIVTNLSKVTDLSPPSSDVQLDELDDLDNHTGLLHVWFLFFDGLASAVWHCPRHLQPHALDVLFDLLRSALDCPGPRFALYAANHLLLPQLQQWLRQIEPQQRGPSSAQRMANFRQSCGLATDLVVHCALFLANTEEDYSTALNTLLSQMLDVLIECVSVPSEVVSRLGCSCIRHLLTSTGHILSEPLWHRACAGLVKACHVALYPLLLVMTLFHAGSDKFYGDAGQIKVAARRHDTNPVECERLRLLACQVFHLENQNNLVAASKKQKQQQSKSVPYAHGSSGASVVPSCTSTPTSIEELRSYVFLLYPPEHVDSLNPDHIESRVQFRSVVLGLLSHQLLLQTIGDVLLAGSQLVTETERHLIPQRCRDDLVYELPGMLDYLSTRNALQLIGCLQQCYNLCCEFDSRPGLKFLFQKVSHATVAANLYRQAGVCASYLSHLTVYLSDRGIPQQLEEACQLRSALPPELFRISTRLCLDEAVAWECGDAGRAALLTSWRVWPRLLARLFSVLTHSYLSMLANRSQLELADRLSEQPLFFLVAQQDELAELRKATAAVVVTEFTEHNSQPYERQTVKVHNVEQVEKLVSASSLPHTPSNKQHKEIAESPMFVSDIVGLEQIQLQQTPCQIVEQEASSTLVQRNPAPKDSEERIYTLVTDHTIRLVMAEYKRRKLAQSLPPPSVAVTSSRSTFSTAVQSSCSNDCVVAQQQSSSLLYDSDARLRSWAAMLSASLRLLLQLQPSSFRALLPCVAPCITLLIGQAEDAALRHQLSLWFGRLEEIYHFGPDFELHELHE